MLTVFQAVWAGFLMPKKIVITGVSRGLGFQLAGRFTEQGHRVAGCSRAGKGPEMEMCLTADVTDTASLNKFAESVLRDFGTPDILINNAAVMNKPANLWEVPVEEFRRLMDVNVTGTLNVIKAFFPAMLKQGHGVVINMSSGWGRDASAEVAPYCASKYAIEGLTLAMSKEVPDGFTVVSLNPGFIATDMAKECFGDVSFAENPEKWSHRASAYILGIGSADNGQHLTVI